MAPGILMKYDMTKSLRGQETGNCGNLVDIFGEPELSSYINFVVSTALAGGYPLLFYFVRRNY